MGSPEATSSETGNLNVRDTSEDTSPLYDAPSHEPPPYTPCDSHPAGANQSETMHIGDQVRGRDEENAQARLAAEARARIFRKIRL